MTVTNLSPNFDSMRIRSSLGISNAGEQMKTFESGIILKLIEGGNTATVKDNKYLVTINSFSLRYGPSSLPNFYQGDGSEKCILDVACGGYFLSGSMLIDNRGDRIPGTIDFGTGTCDNIGSWIFQGKPNEVKFE